MTETSTMSTIQVLASTHTLSWLLPSIELGQIRSHNHYKSKIAIPSKIHTQKFIDIIGTVTIATNNYQCEEMDVTTLKTQNQLVFMIVAEITEIIEAGIESSIPPPTSTYWAMVVSMLAKAVDKSLILILIL